MTLTLPHRVGHFAERQLADRAAPVAGAVAAGQAAALGLLSVTVLVLVGWAAAANTGASASEAVRACLHTWLLAHNTKLVVLGGEFALPPVGLTAACGWLLFRGGQRAARVGGIEDGRAALRLSSTLSATYALIATVLAALSKTDAVRPLPGSAFVGAGVLAAVAGGAGVVRGAHLWPPLWRRLPVRGRLALTAAGGASATLFAGAAALAALSLAGHASRSVSLARSLDAGTTGGVLIGLLTLAYLPTALLWATSYALGPGFALGAGTAVGLGGVTLGAVPAFPLLAALPGSGPAPAPMFVALLIPAGAGVVAGLLLDNADQRRKVSCLKNWRQVLTLSGASGLATGCLVTLCALLADGPAGPGRLAQVGPVWWQVGPAAALWVAVLAAITLFVRRVRRTGWRRPTPES